MRKFRNRSKPPSPSAAADQTNSPQNWLTVSQIIKVLVASGVLLFICNLCYDAAKATILRRLQLEAENKQLRAQLERIDQKILPKVEQAHHEVKDIQKPLQHEKLNRAQLEQLALKARGVCETLEEIEHLLKLNTVAEVDAVEEVELVDMLLGLPNAAKAAALNAQMPRMNERHAKLNDINQRKSLSSAEAFKYKSRVPEKSLRKSSPNNLLVSAALQSTPTSNIHREETNGRESPAPARVERNLSFLGLPVLPNRREPADIRRVILQHKTSIQDCYTRILKDNPAVNGEIKVRLTIAPNGKVVAAALIASTVDHAPLEELILERISRWNDFGEVSPKVGNITFKQTFILGDDKINFSLKPHASPFSVQ